MCKPRPRPIQWQPDGGFTLDVADLDRALTGAEQAIESGDHAAARDRLEQAAALYGGDLLPNCYDDWIGARTRLRLASASSTPWSSLIALLEAKREYEAAIEAAERLLRYDPLHEACYRALMRLYALTGNRASALRIYHTCATVLQRELGVEPSPDTRQAYERLLQADSRTRPIKPQSALAELESRAQPVWP